MIEERLKELGVEIPEPPPAVASYIPAILHDRILWVSGQIPARGGEIPRKGLVGKDLTLEEAQEEAKVCAVNILAQAKAVLGSLERIDRILNLKVYVASAPDFTQQPAVANGASDFLVQLFGEAGRHTRSAISCLRLPLDVPVEIDAVIAVK